MASLNSWLSPNVLHALGWALIHSSWQCLGLAALAAIAMAFSSRPSVRYLIATGTLIAMLAAPVATFLVLMNPAPGVNTPLSANPHSAILAHVSPPEIPSLISGAAMASAKGGTAINAPMSAPKFLPPHLFSLDLLPAKTLPWLVGAWLCGVAFFSLRLAGGFLLLEHRRRRHSSIPDPRVLALCRDLQHQLGLDRAIRYLTCGWLQAPAVIGWFRPIIFLPVAALTGLSEAQLRAVIAHELAHIRRHDFFVNFLQILIETVLFYHPAIWWLNRRIRAERELCCDEIAVSLTGDRLEYARTLARMAEWDRTTSLAMAANHGSLSERIFHIMGRRKFGAGRRILGLTGGFLFLAGALGAANALFGIAYPIPLAHAGHIAPQNLRNAAPQAKRVSPDAGRGATDHQAEALDPAKTTAKAHAEIRLTSSPAAPRLSSAKVQTVSAPVASNDPPAAPIFQALAAVIPLSGADGAAVPLTPMAQIAVAEPKARARICAAPSVAGRIGLSQVSGSDLMTVPVKINGTPKQFLLDFDTDPTEISEPAAVELHLPQIDKSMTSNVMAGPSSVLPHAPIFDVKGIGTAMDYQTRVRVASFTVGESTAQNLKFLVANDRDMSRSLPYDGRLTRRAFGQYDIDFDFGGREINFLTPTGCTDPDQVAYWPHAAVASVPMSLSGGKMQVQVTIGGHVIDAVIDTGSARTVMRRDIAELLLGLKPGTPEMTEAGDLRDGNNMQVYAHTFAQISFAGVSANNVPTLIQVASMVRKINKTPVLGSRATFTAYPADHIPDLALGMDVLHQLHLYAAFDQNMLYVTPAAHRLYAYSAE